MEKKRKTRFGKVISDKMNKTVVVAVDTPGAIRYIKRPSAES